MGIIVKKLEIQEEPNVLIAIYYVSFFVKNSYISEYGTNLP